MAVSEKKEETPSEVSEKKFKYRVTPRYTAWMEGDKIIIRSVLAGVEAKDIEMKALKDRFLLRAARDDVLYDLNLDLNAEIEPEKTKAEYNQGLLRVELQRHNPLDDAYDVPIE